jgi:hypothetical protein
MPAAGRLKLEPMNAQILSCSLSFNDYPKGIFQTFAQCVVNQGGLAECYRCIKL